MGDVCRKNIYCSGYWDCYVTSSINFIISNSIGSNRQIIYKTRWYCRSYTINIVCCCCTKFCINTADKYVDYSWAI